MSTLPEEHYIPLAALQHYMYCPRQCALIHLDREWQENCHTTMGKIEHERVDSGQHSIVQNVYTARSVRLVCHRLGIQGIADAVEYQFGENRQIVRAARPIEYKHGRPKEGNEDAVQLCAQVLCLEEMHQINMSEASIFYHSTRRRITVTIDAELRALTEQCIHKTRQLLQSAQLPPADWKSGCRACSLEAVCLPLKKKISAHAYNNKQFSNLAMRDEC